MIFSIAILLSLGLSQISPHIKPVLDYNSSFNPKYINLNLNNTKDINIESNLNQYLIELPLSQLHTFEIYIEDCPFDMNIFLINPNTLEFIGPYRKEHIVNKKIISDPITNNTEKMKK